jgi:hypothetical protein
MSIKIYVSAMEVKEDGSGVLLFEDYLIRYGDKYEIYGDTTKDLSKLVFEKIEQVEEINEQASSPL